MEATNVTLRIDKGVKEQADDLFASLGLSFTTAVNLFIRKALRTRGIPFDVDLTASRSDRAALGDRFDQLLASDESQRRIREIGPNSPYDFGLSLTPEEIDRALTTIQ